MAQQISPARVYSFVKLPHFIVYCLVVFAVFLMGLIITAHLDSSHTRVSHWFAYDLPWLCELALVWFFPVSQQLLIIVRFLLPILLLMTIVAAAGSVTALHHAIVSLNNVDKARAVESLFQELLLVGVYIPQVSVYKYPYRIVVHQKGSWLSLHYQ